MRFFWWAMSVLFWVLFIERLEALVGKEIARAVDAGGSTVLFIALAFLCNRTRIKL